MTEQQWPKKMRVWPSGEQPFCILCRKPIHCGEKYHYLTRRRSKYLHADCYEKELTRHD